MNYFELFQLPIQFKVDKNELRRKYLELSKQNHPDYFVNAAEHDQQNALETFSQLNKGLKTLSSEDETIRYILQMKGLAEDEEKYTLSPDFLMEVMEVNEQLAEAAMEDDPNTKAQVLNQLNKLEKDLYEPVKSIIENYQEDVSTEEELLQVKDYYFKKKYLNRLRQQFGGML